MASYADSKLSFPELVEEINNLNVGWKANVQEQFADMNLADAKQILGCFDAWPIQSPPNLVKRDVARDIPDSFDARTRWPGSIHAIRNQLQCGSCWAFGASEVLSDRFAIMSDNAIDVVLSAQQLVDCDTQNHGCSGGWPLLAWQYMTDVGLLTEQCYGPYQGVEGPCKINCPRAQIIQCPSGQGDAKFYKASDPHSVAKLNVGAIQTEIMTYGPVEAVFTVYQDFFSYDNGVYRHVSGSVAGLHAIKMLGWGQTSEGTKYWICANSWGEGWGGLGGFFWILRGTNECGIESGITAGYAVL